MLGEFVLRSDMGVACYQGDHPSAMGLSTVVLSVWAVLAPLAVYWVGRWKPDTHSDPRFEFLFGEWNVFLCMTTFVSSGCVQVLTRVCVAIARGVQGGLPLV